MSCYSDALILILSVVRHGSGGSVVMMSFSIPLMYQSTAVTSRCCYSYRRLFLAGRKARRQKHYDNSMF